MSKLVDPSCCEHVMLLYDNDDERDEVVINYINEGLMRGQLAVYASVNTSDESHMSKILSKIADCSENVDRGNLLILSLRSFYERGLAGDLEPLKDFKVLMEEIVKERIALGRIGEVIVVGDCADSLSRNERFDECVYLERWWQDAHLGWRENNQKITVICPHPRSVLDKKLFVSHRQQISRQHSLTITTLVK